uniref:ZP domain-containing protein n=1 Tax=Angiostrongylus cantonensis TaxID=6313 RepID=A0A158P9J5_ANGCA
MTVLLCFLPRFRSVVCPGDMGALFLSNNLISDNYELGSYCYDYCASSNCTGVLVNRNWCLSMNIDQFYGHIGYNNMIFRKEFPCNSITFFAQTRGCFLNTANSSTAKVLDNTENDFHVVYMEHQRLKKLGREQCSNSFHTIPWNQVALRGEAILVNVSGSFDNCLALCSSGCDYAAYSEYFSECFLITYDPNGQSFDFINDDFQVKMRKKSFLDHGVDVELKTICHYDSIIVKQNTFTEKALITEYDQFYRISCDYSNHNATLSVSSALQVGRGNYTTIRPLGEVPFTSMKMELRAKQRHEQNKVILGQFFDLEFDDIHTNDTNYTLANCFARSADGRENITLVENGCPTRTALEYVVRGGIRKHQNGFSLPMRAFRFKNGGTVKIVCRLDNCDHCDTRVCTKNIQKRSYANEKPMDFTESEEVEILLTVTDEAVSHQSTYCVTRTNFVSVSSLGSAALIAQFVVLLKLFHRARSHAM